MNRLMEWEQFNDEVIAHIASYCIPQYGNAPDDEVGAWTAKDCMRAIAKYLGRYGKNARGDADQERDFLKIAHYACLAYWRWKEGKR